ncbi:MAG: SprB repeat-containing protein [Crocinitomicaceae bacterium]|nr:SprB repeat-containing protein [Crocinitomicaceae bacterium]
MAFKIKSFVALVLFISVNYNSNSQVINLGTGANVHTTTQSSPVNIWYRRCVNQTVYTVSELNAAGITGPATIRQLAYYVTQAPVYAIPGYTISMKHTSATNASGNLEGGYTVVKNAFSYTPTAGGWDYLALDTPFNWNGTQNIVVRICWSQVQPNYNASGQCRVYNTSQGYKYRWDDNSGGACGLVPNTTNTNKPQISFIFDTLTVWTGAQNSNWNVANNWTKGIPNQFMDAKIPAGTPNNPNISSNVSCDELVLEGQLTLAANGTLNIYSHFANSGTFVDNGGTTVMKGKSPSNISGTMTISNLRIENSSGTSVTSGALTIGTELQVNKSHFNTGNAVILKSDAVGTARIAELKTSCDYTLTMNDSYGDGWNGGYLTVLENGVSIGTFAASGYGTVAGFTVSSGSTVTINYTAGSWESENSFSLQDAFGTTIYSDAAPISSGTVYSGTATGPWADLISGSISMERYIDAGETYWRNFSSAVENANVGMYLDDFVTAGFPGSPWPSFPFNSIYTYDETLGPGDGWVGCTGTSQIMGVGEGFYVWCGDTITGTDPFTLDLNGKPNQGPISLPVSFTNYGMTDEDGWNMVGNPYASTIDWDSPNWTKTNIADAIYIQDPDNQQYAAYVSGAGTNGGTRYIASQQSFWVYASAASPVLTVYESCKSNVDQAFFKTGNYSPGMTIRIEGNGYTDETVIRHVDGTNDAYEINFDAVERWGGWGEVPQLSVVNNDQIDFTIHSFDLGTQDWVVPVRACVFQNGTYNLVFENTSELDVACLRLEDTYTGLMYDISEGTSFPFDMSDTTWNARFLLHIGKKYPAENSSAVCYGAENGEFEINLYNSANFDYTLSDGTNIISGNAMGDPLVISDLSAGNYTLEIPSLTNVCDQQVFSFTIGQPDELSIAEQITDEVNGQDGSIEVNVSGGTAPYLYYWNNGSTNQNLFNLTEGEYTLEITDQNGCMAEEYFIVGSYVGVESDEAVVRFVYIPQMNIIQILGTDEVFYLINSAGQQIAIGQSQTGNQTKEITLPADLASGVYILRSENSQFKFVKQ